MRIIRSLVIVLPMLVVLALPGCKTPGTIHVDAIKPSLNILADRHDAYVNTGKAPDGAPLTAVQKRTQLRTSALLRGVITAAEKK